MIEQYIYYYLISIRIKDLAIYSYKGAILRLTCSGLGLSALGLLVDLGVD